MEILWLLYEAAQVMLTRVKTWSWLKAWAMNVAKRARPAESYRRFGAPPCCRHAPDVDRRLCLRLQNRQSP
jgi:hypothetical protein